MSEVARRRSAASAEEAGGGAAAETGGVGGDGPGGVGGGGGGGSVSVRAVGVKCNWANLIVNEILYGEGRLLRCPEYGVLAVNRLGSVP